jgi:ABC-type transport system involved in multi-copper enzyme maturation permease subunit
VSAPVFALELVTSARRARYFLWRVLYATLLLAVLVLVYLVSFGLEEATIQAAAEFAQYYLQSFALLQLGAVLLLGPAVSAGAIARERETRTIEYLFTTHLTSAEIVLQKLAAAIAQLTAAVLAGVPVLSLAMLLGGITPEAVLAVTVVTMSTIVVVTSISMAASTVSQRSREATAATYGVLFLVIIGPSIFSGLTRGSALASTADVASMNLQAANPLSVIAMVLKSIDPSAVDAGSAAGERWRAVQTLAAIHLSVSAVLIVFCACRP